MIGILAFTLPIAIIVLIVMAIVRSSRKEKAEDSFQSVIRTIYIYMVMIILLAMLVTATVMLFNSFLEIALPDIVDTTHDQYAAVRDRNNNISDFASNATMLLISVPMFAYYSRLAKNERKKEAIAEQAVETK